MKVKDDTVNIWGLALPMQRVLKEADELWREHGQELVVTSARDSMHSAGSLHYYGLAVDLRNHYFPENVKRQVAHDLQDILGGDYDVILHSTHVHVEYDPES